MATTESELHRVTLALLGGLAAASVLFAHVAAVATPGLDPPPETFAMFVVTAMAAVVGYLLLREESALGYPIGMIAGGFVVLTVALTVAGMFGSAGPETNPIGPLVYTAVGVAVIVTSGLAWRGR